MQRFKRKEHSLILNTTYAILDDFFGKESYHFQDWKLFAGNIRENAKVRIEAFKQKNTKFIN